MSEKPIKVQQEKKHTINEEPPGKMQQSSLEDINKVICSNIFASIVFWNTFVDISTIGLIENLRRKKNTMYYIQNVCR